MKFLVVEMLACLIAASALGLIVGWGMKSMFSGRKTEKLTAKWEKEKLLLSRSQKAEFSSLNQKNDTLLSDMTTLRNKIDSLTASVEIGDKALLHAKETNQALQATIEAHETALTDAHKHTEQLAERQSVLQQNLDSIIQSKDKEIRALKQNLPLASNSLASSDITQTNSSPDLDGQISALYEEREKLAQEHESLVAREEHFSSQLVYGDDTQAYFDETIKLDSLHHFTETSAAETDAENVASDPEAVTRVLKTPPDVHSVIQTPDSVRFHKEDNDELKSIRTSRDKTLWDKVKSGVAKTVDKTRL